MSRMDSDLATTASPPSQDGSADYQLMIKHEAGTTEIGTSEGKHTMLAQIMQCSGNKPWTVSVMHQEALAKLVNEDHNDHISLIRSAMHISNPRPGLVQAVYTWLQKHSACDAASYLVRYLDRHMATTPEGCEDGELFDIVKQLSDEPNAPSKRVLDIGKWLNRNGKMVAALDYLEKWLRQSSPEEVNRRGPLMGLDEVTQLMDIMILVEEIRT